MFSAAAPPRIVAQTRSTWQRKGKHRLRLGATFCGLRRAPMPNKFNYLCMCTRLRPKTIFQEALSSSCIPGEVETQSTWTS